MKKTIRRLLSVTLALVMTVGLFPGMTTVHAAEVNVSGIEEQNDTVDSTLELEDAKLVDTFWVVADHYDVAAGAFWKENTAVWEEYEELFNRAYKGEVTEAEWDELYQAWKTIPRGNEREELKEAVDAAYQQLKIVYGQLSEDEQNSTTAGDDESDSPYEAMKGIDESYYEIENFEPIELPASPYLRSYLDRLDADNGVYYLLVASGDAMVTFDDANAAYQEELDKENPDAATLESLYNAATEKYNELIAAENALEKEYKALEALYQKIPPEEKAMVWEDGNGVSIEWEGVTAEITLHRAHMQEKEEPPVPVPEGPQTWKDKQGVEAFVYRLYNVALTRDGEEEGIADWTDRLNSKKENAAQVAWGFFFSNEFKNKKYTDAQFVEVLYRTMFGRSSDNDGKQYWLSCLENGASREYVYYGFAESEEFSNLCNSFGVDRGSVALSQYRDRNVQATGFIARLYTKMLGRKFDDEGLEYWCKKYLTKENTIEEIASHGFLHSDELTSLNLSDTEFVTRMYETFLNREPEEAGLNDWVGRLERGEVTRDTLVFGFTNSQEFRNLKAEYNLP